MRSCPELQDVWREDESSHTGWSDVGNCRVETIELDGVSTVPACIGQFSLLRDLILFRLHNEPPASDREAHESEA